MSLTRIKAILLQEFFITRHSLEVITDIFYFSAISVIVFGFMNTAIMRGAAENATHALLLGIILWEVVRITQYSISIGALWNVWSRNLSNMFITPLSLSEYIFAQMLSGLLKAIIVFFLVAVIALLFFNFNVFTLGFVNIVFFFINLTLFAWSLGLVLLGFIFRFGTKIQSLAWSVIFLFQPLTATFFPLDVLPSFMQYIALALPATYVFEAARKALVNPGVDYQMFVISLIENIIYFLLSIWFFTRMYKKSRTTGQFARNET